LEQREKEKEKVSEGAVDWEELKKLLDAACAGGQRVVFTNGCFDLLHVGHVRYLKKAREIGDLLVVGLNSDASVSFLKPGRPINRQADRAEVLSALACVDYVCIFDEPTPYELINYLSPDVLVKGGDWRVDEIVGSDIVADTRAIAFEEGYSTTSIIENIKAGHEHDEVDWQEVLFTYDVVEAEIVRDLLESGNIRTKEVLLKVSPFPVNIGRMGEVRIFVPHFDAEKAKELINSSADQ
jgi:rfaE bifunctional protein nucleotidyltransferase chain/domain